MKNRFLREGAMCIPYYPVLRRHCGSIGASVLMTQLDFLFGLTTRSGKTFESGFYKFLEPVPNHEKYVAGDSWCEVLCVTPDEFRTLFDKIGVRYSSLTAYRTAAAEKNPFAGKFYLSFVDRKTNLTWYLRDHLKVDALLDEIVSRNATQHIDFKAPVKPQSQEMANSISRDGKKQGQELGKNGIHNTKTTPKITSSTTSTKSQVVEDIEELVNSILWAAKKSVSAGGRQILDEKTYKSGIKRRIKKDGVDEGDVENLIRFRAHIQNQKQMQTQKHPPKPTSSQPSRRFDPGELVRNVLAINPMFGGK